MLRGMDMMEGVPGPSAERLHRNIRVFEDKLITAQHTFSPRTFHEMAKLLKLAAPGIGRIMSLLNLKRIVENEYNTARHADEHPESSQERQVRVRARRVRVYFKWFLDFVDYLRAMKHNFDTKIHKVLLQLFYDKLRDSPYGAPGTASAPDAPQRGLVSGEGTGKPRDANPLTDFALAVTLTSDGVSQTDQFIQKTIRSIQAEYRDIMYIYANSDLDEMAERLLKLSRKIENLLREDMDLDVTLSKIPKPHNGKKDIGDDVFNFIHLMNLIFAKFKSICELSKMWLETDSRRMKILQEKLRRLKEIQRATSRKKIDLGFAIKKHQLDLDRESSGLNELLKREERVNDLNAMMFDTQQAIISLKGDLQKSREDRDVIAQELLSVPATSKERFQELKCHYEKNRINRYILFKTIQAMEFQKSLIDEDTMVETELRTSIIYSTNYAQETCERLEALIEEETLQRQLLDNIIGPLQKDRQLIESELLRQIMLDNDTRNAPKNFVWGPKHSIAGSDCRASSKLSLPEFSTAENERLGSGCMSLFNPKYSITEVDEDMTLHRNNTTSDFRSRYMVLRSIVSDPALGSHSDEGKSQKNISDDSALSWGTTLETNMSSNTSSVSPSSDQRTDVSDSTSTSNHNWLV